MVRHVFVLVLSLSSMLVWGQEKSLSVAASVQLDSVVIVAQRKGFNVDDFIDLVQNDESFYIAFKNLRKSGYLFSTDMQFSNKKDKKKTHYTALHKQSFQNGCRSMVPLEEKITGKFQKSNKKKYKYYTARMYDRLFITHDTVCIDQFKLASNSKEEMEGRVDALKKLIFSPGQPSGVPFIGSRTEIFSPKMAKYYDFSIRSATYQGLIDCYIFEAKVKPKYLEKYKNRTVIKSLVTYFSKSDFQVVARDYHLAQRKPLYQFDVRMKIELGRYNENYVPQLIQYQGYWDIPAKKEERGAFTLRFSDFNALK
jgi:hypothetical protein